jgi:hypothetical protein
MVQPTHRGRMGFNSQWRTGVLRTAKDGDYQQEMNGPTFLYWFENQLMPALKIPSVIVRPSLLVKWYSQLTADVWGSILNGEQGFLELRDRVGWQFYQFLKRKEVSLQKNNY